MAAKREIKVGLFVLLGLLVTGAVIFLIGNERRTFDSKLEYTTSFPDVQGLKDGASVRMSGVDIGNVTSVTHGPNPNDDRLYVKMSIVRKEAGRVRDDSVVHIANKGLLGDKMLEITPGTPGRPQLPANSSVRSEEPTDYANFFTKAGEMVSKADKLMENLERTTSVFANEQTRKDMQDSMHSVAVILTEVAQGNGYANRLLRDPNEADRLSHTLATLDRSASKLNETLDNVNQVITHINRGPGFAHDVLYSEKGSVLIDQVGAVSNELAMTLKGVRDGNGIAHGVLYGDPNQQKIMSNLSAVSSDLRDVMSNVKAGKGTVGALLVDPSIYEDMKLLLGNVERNEVLRSLVRYSIKEDEKKHPVHVSAPAAAPSPASPR